MKEKLESSLSKLSKEKENNQDRESLEKEIAKVKQQLESLYE